MQAGNGCMWQNNAWLPLWSRLWLCLPCGAFSLMDEVVPCWQRQIWLQHTHGAPTAGMQRSPELDGCFSFIGGSAVWVLVLCLAAVVGGIWCSCMHLGLVSIGDGWHRALCSGFCICCAAQESTECVLFLCQRCMQPRAGRGQTYMACSS